MIVVGSTTVPAELVEFTHEIGVLTAIVERIEDWDAVGRDGDRSTQKVPFCRLRFLRRNRMQRDLPRVLAEVFLRQRHLLLPSGDADHQPVIGNAVRFDIEEAVVPLGLDRPEFDECRKRLRHLRHVVSTGSRLLLIKLSEQQREFHDDLLLGFVDVVGRVKNGVHNLRRLRCRLAMRMAGMRERDRTRPNGSQQHEGQQETEHP